MRKTHWAGLGESSVCWGTHCLNLTKLPQMLLGPEAHSLGGSRCFAAGLGAGTGAQGTFPCGLQLQTSDSLLSGRERIFPGTPVLSSGQEEMEVIAIAQPCSELVLPAPLLPGMAVTLEAGNEGAGCFINALGRAAQHLV